MSLDLPRLLPLAALACAVAACSGSPVPGGGADIPVIDASDTGGGDAPELDQDAEADVAADADDGAGDADPDEGSGGGLGVGEICLSDLECASFLCFRFDATIEEGFCTQYCRDNANCPPNDFECVFLANSGGDFAKVCAPDNLCIDRDGDGFGIGPSCSGPDCDDASDTIFLGADEICDDVDNDCDGNIDENAVGSNTACFTGFPGVCSTGRLLCSSGLSDCVADRRATDELCDGLDNDCDGATDEDADGQPLTEVCYGGPAATLGVGACRAGLRACVDGGIGDCEGAVLPFAELCDGVDNDCDGETDEGMPGAGQPCDVPGALGACVRGRTQCTEAGELICVAERVASEELCDGIDNDCDGATDEDADGVPLQRACYGGPEETRGVGSCVDGTQVCESGDWTACADAMLPVAEVCNSLDDDCDGDTDEDGAAGGFVCSTGLLGACARGVTVCTDLGTECVQAVAASDEVCDGVDNDCDGEVDTHGDGRPLTRSCYGGPPGTAGEGICTAGIQTCGADGFGLCVDEQRPGFETCDGVDNDCDGDTDEGNPGGGIACSTGAPGVCAAGTTVCRGGEVLCEAPVTPGSQPEICDGLDNNCDGSVDEGFPGLGTPCFSGLGNCRRAGVTICDASHRSNPPICDAVAGESSLFEACDYSDDDCDGSVDEGYVDGSGRYTLVADCGGCGINCNNLWPGGAGLYNVVPICAESGASRRCDFDCVAGWEDADGVQENGCEFRPEPDTVYVSAPDSGGSDVGSCGAWTAPCATIGRGLTRAGSVAAARVRVSTGVYRENVTMRNGVSLLGGHNPRNWSRDAGINVTVITGSTPSPTTADRIAVTASGITAATELSGFTINGENAAAGGNSIAVYVHNANNNLQVTSNRIFAGTGGIGVSGTAGSNGANGTNGSVGRDRLVGSCPGSTRTGGNAGSRSCASSVNGGAGGASNPPVFGQLNPTAASGAGSAPGAGGTGGSHMQGQYTRNGIGQIIGRTCSVNLAGPTDGAAGVRGADGSDATGGGGGTGAGTLTGTPRLWRAAAGGTGTAGTSGSGGGGGGASGGITSSDPPFCTLGASGGGGGSGGCAGGAGSGGAGGGGSFAVYVAFDSAPASAAVMPAVTGNTLARAAGGNGGSGGNGGAGGLPGEGARGGLVPGGNEFDFCLTPGGAGGNGGRGGHGGAGGGAAGGASYDVFVAGAGGRDPGYAGNTFAVPAATNTAGVGGAGGASLNPAIGVGANGANGGYGNVGSLN